MATKKISELTTATTVSGTDVIEIVQSGTNKKATLDVARGQRTTFNPTITAGSGTFTSVAATGQYFVDGDRVFFSYRIAITTNGTAATNIHATLPVSPALEGAATLFRSSALGGSAKIITASDLVIWGPSAGYPGSDGEVIFVNGWYWK